MAGDTKTKEQLDAEWWDAWWAEDYSWDGLAKKRWGGWFVHADGSVWDEKGEVSWPPSSLAEGGGGGSAHSAETEGAEIGALSPLQGGTTGGSEPAESDPHPPTASRSSTSPLLGEDKPRPATLQDYWRRDPATGAVRTDEAMLATGELVRDPAGQLWHLVHVPTHWRLSPLEGGTTGGSRAAERDPHLTATPSSSPLQGEESRQTWKSSLDHPNWAHVEALVAARIALGQATYFIIDFLRESHDELAVGSDVVGSDNRAQIRGAVLAKFSDELHSIRRPVQIEARRCRFLGNVDCSHWAFGPGAWFTGGAFLGATMFDAAIFQGDVSFQNARFAGSATFQNTSFAGDAEFTSASFAREASFSSTGFAGYTRFQNARFSGYAHFNHAKLAGDVTFIDSQFERQVSFQDFEFGGVATFHGAVVHPAVTFDGARFTGVHRNLHRAQFVFWPLAALAGLAVLASLFLSGWLDWAAWGVAAIAGLAALVWSVVGGRLSGDDNAQEEHTRAFRRLTLICEEVRNRRDAANFYRLELKAIRLRWKTNPFERFFSWAYDLVADYGESIARPLVVVILMTGLFAAGFWWIERDPANSAMPWQAEATRKIDPDFVDAARYSLSRVFPFGPWVDSEPQRSDGSALSATDCTFRERLLAAGAVCAPGAWGPNARGAGESARSDAEVATHRLLVGFLATLESVFAILLGFLFALAVRRRFQIT